VSPRRWQERIINSVPPRVMPVTAEKSQSLSDINVDEMIDSLDRLAMSRRTQIRRTFRSPRINPASTTSEIPRKLARSSSAIASRRNATAIIVARIDRRVKSDCLCEKACARYARTFSGNITAITAPHKRSERGTDVPTARSSNKSCLS